MSRKKKENQGKKTSPTKNINPLEETRNPKLITGQVVKGLYSRVRINRKSNKDPAKKNKDTDW